MKIRVNGRQYSGFTHASVENRLDALCNTFSFSATSKHENPFPFTGGEACEVFVDDELIVTGTIEIVNVNGNASDVTTELKGRSYTSDLLDSTIGSLEPMQGSAVTMRGLCQHVLSHIESPVEVVDNASPEPFSLTEDIEDPEQGVTAFDFLEKYARKRKVLLTTDGQSRLVITRSSGEEEGGAFVQHQIGDHGLANNVLDFSVSYDLTGRYRYYQVLSQLNMVSLAASGSASPDAIVDQGGNYRAEDEEVRAGRVLSILAESLSSSTSAKNRADWEMMIRIARAGVYSARVHGYRNQAGNLWSVNRVLPVRDDRAGISGKMLLNSVNFEFDGGLGRSTLLGFIRKDAYSLALQEPLEEELGLGLA